MKKSIPPVPPQKIFTDTNPTADIVDFEVPTPGNLEEANKYIYNLSKQLDTSRKRICRLLEPLEFDLKPGKPTMIIKLGDSGKGWIPGMIYFDEIKKFVKASGIDQKYNVLVFHYAINTEVRD